MRLTKIFASLLVLVFTVFANAGAIKELLIEHEESIYREVEQMTGESGANFRFTVERIFNSRFVKTNEDFDVAMESQVEISEETSGDVYEISCTSYFAKDEDGDYSEKQTNCELPD
jgi:hypothetical protein